MYTLAQAAPLNIEGVITGITNLVAPTFAALIAFMLIKYFAESRAAAILGAVVMGAVVLAFVLDPSIITGLGQWVADTFTGGGANVEPA